MIDHSAPWSQPLLPAPSFLLSQFSSLLSRTPGPAKAGPLSPQPGPCQTTMWPRVNLAFLPVLSPAPGSHGLPEPSPGQKARLPQRREVWGLFIHLWPSPSHQGPPWGHAEREPVPRAVSASCRRCHQVCSQLSW